LPHPDLAQAAALVGALGVVLVLLPRGRWLLLAGIAVLGAAEAMLGAALVPSDDLRLVVERPALAAAAAAGIAVVLVAAALFVRNPPLGTVALLLAAPFRIPVEIGQTEAFLLVPLYVVLAAAVLAFAARALRGDPLPALPTLIAVPATVFVSVLAVSALWSRDLRAGSIQLAFFLFPFAGLIAVAARTPFPAWLPRVLAFALVGVASVFAVIGLWQAWTERIFFARDLEVANAYTSFFRVTSLFKDPSAYGRHLVLAIAVVLVALWLGRVHVLLAAAAISLLFAGLYFSYSQSSLVTLFVVTAAVTLVAADRRTRVAVGTACAVCALVGAGAVALTVRDESPQKFTSGRSNLIRNTTEVFIRHPVAGVGVGGQPRASREEVNPNSVAERNTSHTAPLTVAAEVGVIGLAAYLAFLLGAAWLLLETARVDRALGLGLAAVFLVLVVHSLVYSAFVEDPLTWATLALASGFLAARRSPVAAPMPGERQPRAAPAAASIAHGPHH
jgi:O-antigen ligase